MVDAATCCRGMSEDSASVSSDTASCSTAASVSSQPMYDVFLGGSCGNTVRHPASHPVIHWETRGSVAVRVTPSDGDSSFSACEVSRNGQCRWVGRGRGRLKIASVPLCLDARPLIIEHCRVVLSQDERRRRWGVEPRSVTFA